MSLRILAAALCLVLQTFAWAVQPVEIQKSDREAFEAFLGHARDEAKGLTKERFLSVSCPEDFCWLDLPKIDMLLTAYELTGDPSFLQLAATSMNALISVMTIGDDGRRGWYGLPIESLRNPNNPTPNIREIQTDFRAVGVLSRLITLAENDPDIQKDVVSNRDAWIALMVKDLVGYWHDNGYFEDLGERGGIYRWNKDYRPTAANLTLPHEKLSMMVDGLLGLYQVTGNEGYARHAAKVGLWFKRTLTLKDGHYEWSRWSPVGAWDIHPEDPSKWKTWVGADPRGQWYAAAIDTATNLYGSGLVFTKQDMDRFAATQIKVCWNKDAENPQYFQTDGTPAKENEPFVALPLAAFDEDFASFVFETHGVTQLKENIKTPWKGGVLAGRWFHNKYVNVPKLREANPQSLQASFTANPKNLGLAASEALPVVEPGFQTPRSPVESGLSKN